MLGSPILYLKGMRAIMFQLSGFDYSSQVFGLGTSCLGPSFKRVWKALNSKLQAMFLLRVSTSKPPATAKPQA